MGKTGVTADTDPRWRLKYEVRAALLGKVERLRWLPVLGTVICVDAHGQEVTP